MQLSKQGAARIRKIDAAYGLYVRSFFNEQQSIATKAALDYEKILYYRFACTGTFDDYHLGAYHAHSNHGSKPVAFARVMAA